MARLQLSTPSRTFGFSLVEVVISLGITSFAMVSLLGLLSMGLSNQREAMTNMAESQIVQAVTSDLQLTDFNHLADETRYFDRSGKPLPAATGFTDPDTLYRAEVTLQAVTDPDAFPLALPGQAYSVRIKVTNRTRPGESNTYAMVVARTTR